MKTLRKNVLPQGHGHHVGVGQKEDLPLLWLVSLEVITNVLRVEKMSAGHFHHAFTSLSHRIYRGA